MIFGDFLLLIFFFFDLLEGYDVGLDLFMIIFLLVDTLLSADYIIGLNKKEKLEDKITDTEFRLQDAQEKNTDHEIANSIRRSRQIQEERDRLEELQRQREEEQKKLDELKKQREAAEKQKKQEELDPEELQSMLQSDFQNESQTQTK